MVTSPDAALDEATHRPQPLRAVASYHLSVEASTRPPARELVESLAPKSGS